MTQPHHPAERPNFPSLSHSTGRTVIAFGMLLELSSSERYAKLAALRIDEPALAAELEQLFAHESSATKVLTNFAVAANPTIEFHARLKPGDRFGDFELIEPLGSGGMGIVWRAQQHNPSRHVALKLIALGATRASRSSAISEPSALAALRHPFIATIFASGIDGETAWIAMELVENARDITTARSTLSFTQRVELISDVADAIAHAHAAGFIHRDVKPSNILIDGAGKPKVIDFGIALAVTHAQLKNPLAWCGTPAYLAPEALDSEPNQIDARADVYALGVVLYEIVYGALPAELTQRDPIALLRALRTVSFAPPANADRSLRGDLSAIIMRATQRDLSLRYRTIAALSDDLRAYLAHRPTVAAPRNALGRARLVARRNPVAATLASITLTALVAATVVSTFYALYARTAAIEAGELATQTDAVYRAFLNVFIPDDASAARDRALTVSEFMNSRVTLLEREAAQPKSEAGLRGTVDVARTLMYTCAKLEMPLSAARCNFVIQAVERRLSREGYRELLEADLDAVYAALLKNPDDHAALASLNSILPRMLEQQRIVRTGVLARISAVRYLRSTRLTLEVANRLLDLEDAATDVRISACSTIILSIYSDATQPGPVTPIDPHLLDRVVQEIQDLSRSEDGAARAEARSLANGTDIMFSFNLVLARHPELAAPLLDIVLCIAPRHPDDMAATPSTAVGLNYFSSVPRRLERMHAWDSCALVLAEIDSRDLVLQFHTRANLLAAQVPMLMRNGAPSALSEACARYDDLILSADGVLSSPRDAFILAAVITDRGDLLAQLGDHTRLQHAIEHASRTVDASITANPTNPVTQDFIRARDYLIELLGCHDLHPEDPSTR